MKSSELDYELPEELIAQHPVEPRDSSRLLVYDRATGDVRHRRVRDLPHELRGELVTFRPLTEETLEEHRIHGERYAVEPRAWERIRAAGRVLAVGTTTLRV